MEEKPPQVPAFKESLTRSKFDDRFMVLDEELVRIKMGKLFEFEKDDRYIVRKVAPSMMPREETDLFAAAAGTKRLFRELQEKYNISIPIEVVIAQDENSPRKSDMFVMVERIHPADQHLLTPEEQLFSEKEYFVIWNSIVSYYEDRVKNGGDFLEDLGDKGQYVFGKKSGDLENHWHFIDGDPFYSNDREYLLEVVEGLYDELENLEKENGSNYTPLVNRCEILKEALVDQLESKK